MVNTAADIQSLIIAHREQILKYGATSIGLFGSFINGKVTKHSDVDLLVEFEAGQKTYDNFINLALFLESLLGRKVELITPSSLSKYLKPHIEKSVQYVAISV